MADKLRGGSTVGGNLIWHTGNDGSGSGLDADLLDGMNATTAATANTIVARDANGYVYANALNSTLADTANSASHYMVETGSDGWLRPKTLANVKTEIAGDRLALAGGTLTGSLAGTTFTGTSFNSITALSSTAPVVAGTAAVGTSTTVARADHVHPLQTTITGNAATATTATTANALNAANAYTGTSFNSITGLASVAPVAPAVTAAVGTSTAVARQDHVHPTNFTATATDIKMNGTQAVGTLTTFARADHVHPTDTSRAPLASPALTGTPTAPTAATTVNSTQLATTAFATPRTDATGASVMPAGTTAQRPVSPVNGYMRYNSELLAMEAYVNGAWGSVGGGATGGGTGGGTDKVFNENGYVVTANYTIPAGKSAVTVGDASGDVTINSGVTVTLDSNSRWVIL
jgi:hypothetical protein